MKKIITLVCIIGLLVFIYSISGTVTAATKAVKPAKQTAKASCAGCHEDFTTVLPKGHPAVSGKDITACISCHTPDTLGKAEANAFSTRMHLAHQGAKSKVDCMSCHIWVPGKSFGLQGSKVSWGAPSKEDMKLMRQMTASWAGSPYLDHRHAIKNIMCMGCHGKSAPREGDTVENDRCLACHGPLDKLAARSAPKDIPDRNPHKSHLGDIACTVCHKGHSASSVYCLQCHSNFQMTMPESRKK